MPEVLLRYSELRSRHTVIAIEHVSILHNFISSRYAAIHIGGLHNINSKVTLSTPSLFIELTQGVLIYG